MFLVQLSGLLFQVLATSREEGTAFLSGVFAGAEMEDEWYSGGDPTNGVGGAIAGGGGAAYGDSFTPPTSQSRLASQQVRKWCFCDHASAFRALIRAMESVFQQNCRVSAHSCYAVCLRNKGCLFCIIYPHNGGGWAAGKTKRGPNSRYPICLWVVRSASLLVSRIKTRRPMQNPLGGPCVL